MTLNKSLFASASDEWETPQALFDFWNNIHHFTLDVAATVNNTKAGSFFTQQTNGLTSDWGSNRVWCNPPYGRGAAGAFVAKAIDQVIHKKITESAVFLLPARTDTKLWHEQIFNFASEIVFLKGRVQFIEPTGKTIGSAPFPSAIVVFEQDWKKPLKFGTAPADPSAPNSAITYVK